jgi:hypothetical protein
MDSILSNYEADDSEKVPICDLDVSVKWAC